MALCVHEESFLHQQNSHEAKLQKSRGVATRAFLMLVILLQCNGKGSVFVYSHTVNIVPYIGFTTFKLVLNLNFLEVRTPSHSHLVTIRIYFRLNQIYIHSICSIWPGKKL